MGERDSRLPPVPPVGNLIYFRRQAYGFGPLPEIYGVVSAVVPAGAVPDVEEMRKFFPDEKRGSRAHTSRPTRASKYERVILMLKTRRHIVFPIDATVAEIKDLGLAARAPRA